MSDKDRKDLPATDPWSRWRKPETAPRDGAGGQPQSETAVAPTEAPVEPEAKDLVGKTLGVRKVVKAAVATGKGKKPYGGGKRDERSGDRRDERPYAGKREARPEGKTFVKPEGRRDDNPWAKSGPRPVKSPAEDRRSEQPRAKSVAAPVSTAGAEGVVQSGVRLSKVMSERGLCSRREADLWIERGWVFVNGEQISELGSRIDPAAEITISTEAKKDQAKQVTILLHKPVGYVSGQPEPGCIPAVTLITAEAQVVQSGDPEFKPWMLRGLAPAGRLDVDSTGLLVLTSDGRVAKRLIGEDSDAEKEYLVRVSGQMIKGGLELLRHGLELDGKPLRQAWVKQLNEDQLHFILKEGKKRQIRRMCELVGLRVIGLKRVRIGRIRLGDLPMGQWRFLRADEAF
jgi:23S rRNA pseudouridine2604 synthase